MELTNYLQKFSLPKKNLGQNLLLADEVYQFFSKKILFPRIMHEIKTKGIQFVRENFEQVKKLEVDNKLSLFIWRLKQAKVK